MGTRYSQQTASGYNTTPPSDDGTEVDSNKVKWAHVTSKIGGPLKTLAENIDAALRARFDEGPDAKSANYTTLASDFAKTIEVTSGATISLGQPGTVGAGYRVTVKNTDSPDVTVDVDGGGTIDGESSVTIQQHEAATFLVDAAEGEYNQTGVSGPNLLRATRTVGRMEMWPFSSAPTGWLFTNGETIGDTGSGADHEDPDYKALFDLIKAEGSSWGNTGSEVFGDGDTVKLPDLRDRSPLGTATMGTDDAERVDNHSTGLGDTGGEDAHQLTEAELASHNHGGSTGSGGNHRHDIATDADGTGGTNADFVDVTPNAATGNAIYNGGGGNNSYMNTSGGHSHNIPSDGGDAAHNNMPPFAAINFIIQT